jgi:RND family efflux transporter MFP subunit
MKSSYISIFIIGALLITACSGGSTPNPLPTVSLDSGSPITSNSGGFVTASGEVRPVDHVELSFPTSGSVKTVDVAAGDQVTEGQTLVTLDTAILEAKVREAEANVIIAEAHVHYLQRVGTHAEELDSAKADVESAKAAVDIAKAQLSQGIILAPLAGTIASVEVSPAEFVNAGQVILTLGDLTHFRVETTDLSEKDVAAVKLGAQANVFIEALNEEFTGKVIDIARISEKVGGDVVFKVTIELDDQPEGLRWGMSTDVSIQTP